MSSIARIMGETSSRRLWCLVFLIVGLVYALSATYSPRQANDTVNTAVQAHQIATTGSPALDGLAEPHTWLERQLREGRHGTVTDRHPGSVLAGVVAYTLAGPLLPAADDVREFLDVPIWPASLAAALLAAAAVATAAVALSRMRGIPSEALPAIVFAFAFGTATWSVSANALWPHSVTQFGLAIAIAGLAASGPARAGVGFALAILARTHTAVIAAVGGLSMALEQRRWRPVITIGALSLVGLGGAVLYGMWVFGGGPSLTVGRGSVAERVAHGGGTDSAWAVLGNQLLLLVHPLRGVLPTTPMLVPLLVTVPTAWRSAPLWVRGLALGGLAQLILQGFVNIYTGGAGFFGSRVTLEFLTATLPLWALAYIQTLDRPRLRLVTHALAMVSVVLHALGATVWHTGLDIPFFSAT